MQSVSLLASAGEDVYLSFLEQNITVTIGTDTPATIQAALEALLTASIYNGEIVAYSDKQLSVLTR